MTSIASPPTVGALVDAAAKKLTPLSIDPRSYLYRARFLLAARRARSLIGGWLDTRDLGPGGLVRSLVGRPEMIGIVRWPYINNAWGLRRRFEVIADHYRELHELPSLRLEIDGAVALIDLGDIFPGLRVILDRPTWFLREGELTLNLFVDAERVYSLAFSLGRLDGQRVVYVGGIQGRRLETAQALYRELTKALHGLRPRDLVIAMLQDLCGLVGVQRILAVEDANRHQRHPYFGSAADLKNSANYDEIWRDRGGQLVEGGFYQLPGTGARRSEAEISPGKRAMYRRRYAMLDRAAARIAESLVLNVP